VVISELTLSLLGGKWPNNNQVTCHISSHVEMIQILKIHVIPT